MSKKTELLGVEKVLQNLNKEAKRIGKHSMASLIRVMIFIRREMDPLIPIDTGNLRASFFNNPMRTSMGPIIIFGFTANYAVHVHENIDAKFKKPTAEAKFMEKAIDRNKGKILLMLQQDLKG